LYNFKLYLLSYKKVYFSEKLEIIMKTITIFIVLLLSLSVNYAYSQDNDILLGKERNQTTPAFYDVSDPL